MSQLWFKNRSDTARTELLNQLGLARIQANGILYCSMSWLSQSQLHMSKSACEEVMSLDRAQDHNNGLNLADWSRCDAGLWAEVWLESWKSLLHENLSQEILEVCLMWTKNQLEYRLTLQKEFGSRWRQRQERHWVLEIF